MSGKDSYQTEDASVVIAAGNVMVAIIENGKIDPESVPGLLKQIRDALSSGSLGRETAAPLAAKASTDTSVVESGPQPAVPVAQSIKPDYLVCLEDGRRLKMLKRYLRQTYNMTPEAYRQKWGLPKDYPMVAPNYSEVRSDMAKRSGLGRPGSTKSKRRKDGSRTTAKAR